MNTRVFTLVSAAAALALFAGCTAVYKNSALCEDRMRSAAGEDAASETMTISHTGAGIHGSRVVVEGAFVSTVPASSVPAIQADWAGLPPPPTPSMATAAATAAAASNSSVAAAAAAASAASAAAVTSMASPTAPAWQTTSTPMAVLGATAPPFAAAPVESGTAKPEVTRRGPAKPVKLAIPAAMECQFDGESLTSFRWLAPAKLAKRADVAASEPSE
ncbi:hypothetical protein [Paraburkholderia solisilvae]|uniref:Ig-like domain-containing protein n=1 Tax=Paraburkholderia solisilvae TaxID=624376 RepID=A0A6J5EPM8_9BURK|nr:hypothetical protein [Paraburkholderia solisilvae]CAB3767172.1 hypothetical protein LMG29739_05016 [Paraburkholderia solisilvae]